MNPVIFTAAAEADVEEAFRWYEAQREGLGAAFRHALDIAVSALESNPEAYEGLALSMRPDNDALKPTKGAVDGARAASLRAAPHDLH